jgi:hypothetical protein
MATLIEQWQQSSMALVQAAIDYANGREYSSEADHNIHIVRTLVPILSAAVAQASAVQRPPPSPGGEPEPEGVAAMAARRRA